jgi:hypothetical protein
LGGSFLWEGAEKRLKNERLLKENCKLRREYKKYNFEEIEKKYEFIEKVKNINCYNY